MSRLDQRITSKTDFDPSSLVPLFDGISAGKSIPERVRSGLQHLIELEAASIHGSELREGSIELHIDCHDSRTRLLASHE